MIVISFGLANENFSYFYWFDKRNNNHLKEKLKHKERIFNLFLSIDNFNSSIVTNFLVKSNI